MIKKELKLIGLADEENFEVEFKQEFQNSDVIVSGKKDVVLNDGTINRNKINKRFRSRIENDSGSSVFVHIPQLAMYLAERKLKWCRRPNDASLV